MDKPHQLTPDIEILPAYFQIPGAGFLAVNAFVIKAKEPVLVDTGMGIESEAFMKALESVIDPQDIRWVWLTHDDADHTGSIQKILEAAPKARLAANALAVMRMSTAWPVPMDRVYWLNPGESIRAGDRVLTAVRPPLFDNPTTIGAYDNKSGVFFSADCFGAIIPSPSQSIDHIVEGDLAQYMIHWASGDNPWVHMVEPGIFSRSLDKIRKISPKMILSAHLPPMSGRAERLLDFLAAVPASTPFVAPNQMALDQILAEKR
ncbi:MAG: MBL fold metallo-hydrolase [Desulfobacteraceae bacterium]|nr:MAG: MBL fold metallo-hydrolase [Desulfobacteraceae bacterium]